MAPIPQDTSATCWRAGYQMMFQWKQKVQAGIENPLRFEIDETAWETCNQNGLLRKYWGNAVYAYGMYGHSERDSTKYEYVRDMLSSHGPILFHYTRDKGYDDDYENILIIDPVVGPGHGESRQHLQHLL